MTTAALHHLIRLANEAGLTAVPLAAAVPRPRQPRGEGIVVQVPYGSRRLRPFSGDRRIWMWPSGPHATIIEIREL